ncbi:MAG: glycosyltransferase family 9 protein [Desulfovibrionaceae bacterium]
MHKDKVILVHNGAMGDFLTVWPALAALARHAGRLPKPPALYWAGRATWLPWAAPLGVTAAPAALRQAVEALYTTTRWPDALHGCRVIWFCLTQRPGFPVALDHPDLWLLPTVHPGEFAPPRDLLRHALARRGVAWADDWLETWRRFFGAWQRPRATAAQRIPLFPGAGHRRKQWGVVKFLELAQNLRQAGLAPFFVLGPAERDRGMDHALGTEFPCETPDDMAALSALLLGASAVAGNDCGPMHLAGMHGVPGVAIFGPTSERQWGPQGMAVAASGMDCRPCTQTTASLACPHGACLEAVTVARVLETIREVVA